MRIDGRSIAHARGEAVNAFQNDPNCRVALLSIRAAGVSPPCLHAWPLPVTHGWDRTLLLALCEALKRCRSGPTKSQRECYACVWRHAGLPQGPGKYKLGCANAMRKKDSVVRKGAWFAGTCFHACAGLPVM